ncbi:hypothetical protein PCANC_05531 [Puccinia coronata f. sp. avenae]|uniref:Uncharacterized protein n=1 Tax=Puccinia coronata f. sp. avenae TaxID=200324 RepID=A0A2N5VP58_9BASI|nr:hypothetical protein PCANC_05531 [Puccinia coronata f. sp. avenae]
MQPQGNASFESSDIPPLPFPNAPGGTQQSWLGPSQSLGNNQSCRIFFEESLTAGGNGTGQSRPFGMAPPNSQMSQMVPPHSQMAPNTHMPPNNQMFGVDPRGFQLFYEDPATAARFQMAAQAQLNDWCASSCAPERLSVRPPPAAKSPAQPGAKSCAQPANERRAIMPPPEPASHRVLHLDYAVYIRSVSNELTRAHSKRPAPASKDWKKSVPKGDIIWKTGMTGWTWRSFKEALIQKLDESRHHEHFGKHLTKLDKDDDLKWKCMVTHHRVYGVKSHAYVTDEDEFEEFAEAVNLSPSSKCTVKIVMEDPGALAKKLQNEKCEAEELALMYGDDDERLSLERSKTRLAANPKADVQSEGRAKIVKKLTALITKTAILLEAPGVDYKHPPETEEFVSEPIKLWTKEERKAATLDARSGSRSPKSSNPEIETSTRSKEAKTPKETKKKTRAAQSPEDEEPKRKYTPARKLPCGRWMAPRLIPQTGASKTPTPETNDDSSDSDPESERLPPVLEFDMDEGTREGPASKKDRHQAGNLEYPVEVSDDELSTTDSEPQRHGPQGKQIQAYTSDSSDVEVPHAKAKLAVHRSPARKAARSPAGGGVHGEFSRLSFDKKRQTSPFPTRKRPISRVSSSLASVPPPKDPLSPHTTTGDASTSFSVPPSAQPSAAPSSPVDSSLASNELPRPPLTKEGRDLTLEGFLAQCYFPSNNYIAHGLLALNCIGHWDFFRSSSVKQLMGVRLYPSLTPDVLMYQGQINPAGANLRFISNIHGQ